MKIFKIIRNWFKADDEDEGQEILWLLLEDGRLTGEHVGRGEWWDYARWNLEVWLPVANSREGAWWLHGYVQGVRNSIMNAESH